MRAARMPRLSYFDVRERIAALRRSNLNSMDDASLLRRLKPLFKGYSLRTPILKAGTILYRGVRWDERPRFVRNLSHPPVTLCTSYQRANGPRDPMFYCSVAWPAPVFELQMSSMQKLALSRWRVRKDLFVNSVGFTANALTGMNSGRQTAWWLADESKIDRASLLVSEFLADEFTRLVAAGEEHRYKLSAAIARRLLGERSDLVYDDAEQILISGLIYPAIPMCGNADNLVLKPQAVEEFLICESVEFLEISEIEEGESFQYRKLDFANSMNSNDEIEWKGRPAHWELQPGEFCVARIIGGNWRMFDAAGAELQMK